MAFAVLDLALTSAVALLVTIDPIGTGPIFAALTRGSDDAHRRRMAIKGVVIAAIILFVFAFVGPARQRREDRTGPDRIDGHQQRHRRCQGQIKHDWTLARGTEWTS